MKGTASIMSALHALKTADEHFLDFLRECPEARIERMVKGYVNRVEWIAKDLCACPFFTPQMVDALKEEWNSDTLAIPDIHEKILRLSPQKREELDLYIDKLLNSTLKLQNMENENVQQYQDPAILAIAKVCHETNRAYCATIGDDNQPSWEEAPEWQKQSAYNGVVFHLANPSANPEDSHNSWLKEKEETGWKYGPVKDAEKKEHPCFMPYSSLPESQQKKDALFIAVVRALK